MKVQELRIGNYIDVEGKFERVSDLVRYKNEIWAIPKSFENWSRLANECKPIPLTKRIMIKCGFTNTGWLPIKPKTRSLMKDGRPIICYGREGGFGLGAEDNFFFVPGHNDEPFYGHPVDLMYVHQLQNLYFALTGEELDIEL
jgi:hypothetical protein